MIGSSSAATVAWNLVVQANRSSLTSFITDILRYPVGGSYRPVADISCLPYERIRFYPCTIILWLYSDQLSDAYQEGIVPHTRG